ncbi:MAG: hypothetical protein AAGF32_05895 [Pseudomonadota bacterium]
MKLAHHPDTATLLSLSAGTASESLTAVMMAHLELCPECHRARSTLDAIGGALFDDCKPAPLSFGPQEALTDRDLIEAPFAPFGEPVDGFLMDPLEAMPWMPRCLMARLACAGEIPKWSGPVDGVRTIAVPLRWRMHGVLELWEAAPGASLPQQPTRTNEAAVVLAGTLQDGFAQYGPGDFMEFARGSNERPTVRSSEPCVCLVSADCP